MSYSLIPGHFKVRTEPGSVHSAVSQLAIWFIRTLQNAALILSVPKASVKQTMCLHWALIWLCGTRLKLNSQEEGSSWMLSDIHVEFQILTGRYLGLLAKVCCCCCYCLVLLHFLNNSCRWREWLIGCITIFIQMVNLGLSGEGRSQSFLLLPWLCTIQQEFLLKQL